MLEYLAAQSARQCGPCRFGLPAVAEDFAALARGDADAQPIDRLHHCLGLIPGRGACSHPDAAARLAASALRVFADDVHRHVRTGPCRAAYAPLVLPVPAARPPGGGMAMTRAQAHVLAANFAACDGHGLCAELLPELVGLDTWGYPVLRSPTVPPDLLPHARRAVATCPVMALRLNRVPTPAPDQLPTRGSAAPRRAVSHGQPG